MSQARTSIALSGLAFALFALAAPPGPYLHDSGELAAAAFTLGVPHPTGFPLFCLLGKLATLVPLGEIAFRLHLLSAACGALTVGLVAALALELAPARDGAALAGAGAAAALLALGATSVRQLTTTEVYAPLAAAIAGALLLAARAARGRRRAALGLALLCGLALGGHAWFRLVLLAPALALLALRLRRGDRALLHAPALVAVGAALVLYLPVASARRPPIDWGEPRRAGAAWEHVTAARIRAAFASRMLSTEPLQVEADAVRLGAAVEGQLGVVGGLLALAGAVGLVGARRRRLAGVALVGLALADALYALSINPMGLEELQDGTALAVVGALLAGLGAAGLGRRLGRGVAATATAALLAALAGGALVAAGALPDALAARPAAEPLAQAALAQAPPRALALTRSDDLTASLLYEQLCAGARPDVAVLARQHLPLAGEVALALGRAGLRLAREPAALLRAATLWEPGDDAAPRDRALAPAVPLFVLAETPAPPLGAAALRALAAAWSDLVGPARRDAAARAVHGRALSALARWQARRGDPDAAAALFHAALLVRPDDATALVGLGALRSGRGDARGAAALTSRALALRPDDPVALANLGRYRLALSDLAGAAQALEAARRLEPSRAETHALLGVIAARRGRVAEARARFERALALDPWEPDARANLARLPPAAR